MLREMRGPHGGPRLRIRLLALVLALLLAFPLTVLLLRVGSYLLDQVV